MDDIVINNIIKNEYKLIAFIIKIFTKERIDEFDNEIEYYLNHPIFNAIEDKYPELLV